MEPTFFTRRTLQSAANKLSTKDGHRWDHRATENPLPSELPHGSYRELENVGEPLVLD